MIYYTVYLLAVLISKKSFIYKNKKISYTCAYKSSKMQKNIDNVERLLKAKRT